MVAWKVERAQKWHRSEAQIRDNNSLQKSDLTRADRVRMGEW